MQFLGILVFLLLALAGALPSPQGAEGLSSPASLSPSTSDCLHRTITYALLSRQGAGSLSSFGSSSSSTSPMSGGSRDDVVSHMNINTTAVAAAIISNGTAMTSPASNHKALQCEPDPCIDACHLAVTIITLGLSCCW
ncbi:hypothetical protein PspLS_07744 [Pyricularia sp. CBS 133598]|nr:hypothetical protein PspLS_07744 [Pyricularia sp. CBS 133598]